jgi:hypothetical protein
MDENELFEMVLWTNHSGQRAPDRPKSRWIVGVDEDARKLGGRNCLSAAQDRGRWRHLLEEAKAKAHRGL